MSKYNKDFVNRYRANHHYHHSDVYSVPYKCEHRCILWYFSNYN